MNRPEPRYAKTTDGVHIAYQVVGTGPFDLYVPGWVSNLEMMWEEPPAFLERLASFARLSVPDRWDLYRVAK